MKGNTVLVVEDDASLREALCDTLRIAGYPVAEAHDGRGALAVLAEQPVGIIVTDVQMERMNGFELLNHARSWYPDLPVVLITAYGSIEGAVKAMRDGAVDYLPKPFDSQTLIARVRRFLGQPATEYEDLVCEDPLSRELVQMARRVAGAEVTVMITGESGTGKEVVARYLHRHSRRAAGQFVAINCAAIPENMLEATLFGYEKGAFTGAYQATPGKFEQAQGGTLLLDEISEMDLGLQAKLLRVLQEREVERLGSRKTVALDVRVLATSNRELRKEVAAGRFRSDLYYRLNVFPVHIPPLRERPGDILPLAARLLEKAARIAQRGAPELTPEAQARLLRHRWPGNVRELDNLLNRALILCIGETIGPQDLVFETPSTPENETLLAEEELAIDAGDLKANEQRLILDTLEAVGGNRNAAASRLGISPRTLRYKVARMRACGVAIPGQRGTGSP